MSGARSALATAAALLAACSGSRASPIELPLGFTAPRAPRQDPLTAEKIELGRYLFYDRRLSANQTQSCASCHHRERGFAEDLPVSVGSTGEALPRNAPGLLDAGYYTALTWNNPLMTVLERQVVVPMFADAPVELGITGNEKEIARRLAADPRYPPLFAAAFPGAEKSITIGNAAYALASFVRSMVSADSPYDRFARGQGALSAAERRGMTLFFSDRLRCSECHAGPNFSVAAPVAGDAKKDIFFNTGLYDVDGKGGYPRGNTGLYALTNKAADMGKFRVPSLRNVALTAPYYHDGSAATLEDVIRNYAAAGRGAGRENRYKDPRIAGFTLAPGELEDLVAFLGSLTDRTFIDDERFGDPWRR